MDTELIARKIAGYTVTLGVVATRSLPTTPDTIIN